MGKSKPHRSIAAAPETPAQSKDVETGQMSCSDWNSLVRWARGQRGPQWDSSTAMYQVPQNSDQPEYWQGVEAIPQKEGESSTGGPSLSYTQRPHTPDTVTFSATGRPMRHAQREGRRYADS